MEITELVGNERVVWTCVSQFAEASNPASEWFGRTFAFDIASRRRVHLFDTTQDVTIVRLRSDGWTDDARWFGFCSTGWSVTLTEKLKPFCESGSVSCAVIGEG